MARGVDVLRGVGVALRGGVGEGVQVGSIWTRFVALGTNAVVGGAVGVAGGVVVVQLTSKRMHANKNILIFVILFLPFDCVSVPHSFPARRALVD